MMINKCIIRILYILYLSMTLKGGAMAEKETIEKADFTNLTWKLEGVDVSLILRLSALIISLVIIR